MSRVDTAAVVVTSVAMLLPLARAQAVLDGAAATQPAWAEIVITLRDGRYYSAEEFARQASAAFDEPYDLSILQGKELEITPVERAALLLLAGSSSYRDRLRVTFTPDRLTLAIRRTDSGESRRLRRRVLDSLGLTPGPEQYKLTLPPGWASDHRTIIMVHGLESSSRNFDAYRKAFTKLGWQVGLYDYPNDGPIDAASRRLSDRLKDLRRLRPDARFVLLATSMGGLVCRHCLETPGLDPGNVTDLVMLATPNHGSYLAFGQPLLELFMAAVHRDIRLYSIFFDGLGEAAEDLQPGSPFLRELNGRPRNPKIRYHLALGDQALLTPDEWRTIVTEVRRGYIKRFNRFRFTQPNTKTLKRFSDIAAPIFRRDHLPAEQDGELRQIRYLLLPKLISGELDMSELDIVPEEVAV